MDLEKTHKDVGGLCGNSPGYWKKECASQFMVCVCLHRGLVIWPHSLSLHIEAVCRSVANAVELIRINTNAMQTYFANSCASSQGKQRSVLFLSHAHLFQWKNNTTWMSFQEMTLSSQ